MSQFLKGIDQARDQKLQKAARAVDVFAEQVLGDAQQLCPVDTGDLIGSATPKPIAVQGDTITKEIGFNADYAAAVHENLEANHKVGQAKFLETAMQEDAKLLSAAVRIAVEGSS